MCQGFYRIVCGIDGDVLPDALHPDGHEELTDQERYRVRQGLYSVVYEIRDDMLVVTVVGVDQ